LACHPERSEHDLADLADRLVESYLAEEIWGGWPLCPAHPTRPMWPTIDTMGRAVWQCEADRATIEIGRFVEFVDE
jgi:hypothetical protein